MPFINDVLAHNQQQNRAAAEASQVSPVGTVRSRYAFDAGGIAERLRARIVGQDHVLESLCQQLKVIKAGLTEPRRPLLVMLLLGDTGVGKTETVRLLAEAIHGDAGAFCRIDMNTLSQSHYSAAITGAPPGYVGSKENTTLLDEAAILGSASRPGIVLFDEVEKASQEVVRSLMNVFDSGHLRLASGTRELSFTNCLVFMTSNLGAESWRRHQHHRWWHGRFNLKRFRRSHANCRSTHFEAALRAHFDPEFLNRIDCIELFDGIGANQVSRIVLLEVERINQQLMKKQIQLQVSDAVIEHIAAQGFDEHYGARALRRSVRDRLLVPLSAALLDSGALTGELKGAGAQVPQWFVANLVEGRVQCSAR
ncbi:MAG: AAA family ATPase [Pseudomonadota bacterium]|nr:AAA family ATPase [Pseudomonadota bacterium]